MKQRHVAEFVQNEKFEGFLLVKNAEIRVTKAGLNYLDMTLADKSGEINAKNWDVNAAAPPGGSIIKVKADVIDFKGKAQLKIEKMRELHENEAVDMTYFVKCAPDPVEDMLAYIRSKISAIAAKDLQTMVSALFESCVDKLTYFPAAKEMHHAEKAGLLHHLCDMLKVSDALSTVYTWVNWDLVRAGIVVHDLQKTTEMISDSLGIVKEYSKDGLLIGHLVRGAISVQVCADKLGIKGECVELLQHMIISHHGIPEYGSPRPPMFAEAEMLHFIDTLDAKMYQINNELSKVKRGVFTDWVKALERRLYRPDFDEIQ